MLRSLCKDTNTKQKNATLPLPFCTITALQGFLHALRLWLLLILGEGGLCYQRKRDEAKADLGVLWATVTVVGGVKVDGNKAAGGPQGLAPPGTDALPAIYCTSR